MIFKEQNFSKLRAISTVQYVDEENALKNSVIISNMFHACDGLKAVSSWTPPILFSVFISITLTAVTTYGVITLVLNETPFILIVMCLWCNKTIFRVKDLNRSIIHTKVQKGTSHNAVWTIILLLHQNHGISLYWFSSEGPQELSSPNFCSTQDQPWGQTRMLRALSLTFRWRQEV